MIEISSTGLGRSKSDLKSKKSSTGTVSKAGFASKLSNAIESDFVAGIEDLMTDLSDQEKKFLDNQSLYELEKYKRLVKKILKLIVEEGFETKALKLSFRERRSGQSEKTVVKIIDEKLIEISEMITKSNEAFGLMKKIEEIRGLICDLVY